MTLVVEEHREDIPLLEIVAMGDHPLSKIPHTFNNAKYERFLFMYI